MKCPRSQKVPKVASSEYVKGEIRTSHRSMGSPPELLTGGYCSTTPLAEVVTTVGTAGESGICTRSAFRLQLGEVCAIDTAAPPADRPTAPLTVESRGGRRAAAAHCVIDDERPGRPRPLAGSVRVYSSHFEEVFLAGLEPLKELAFALRLRCGRRARGVSPAPVKM